MTSEERVSHREWSVPMLSGLNEFEPPRELRRYISFYGLSAASHRTDRFTPSRAYCFCHREFGFWRTAGRTGNGLGFLCSFRIFRRDSARDAALPSVPTPGLEKSLCIYRWWRTDRYYYRAPDDGFL